MEVKVQPQSPCTAVGFLIDEQRYALPLDVVEQSLPMCAVLPLPDVPPVVLGALSLDGLVVPVLDVRRRLGLPDRRHGISNHLLVARIRQITVALPVDEVLGTIELDPATTVRPDPAAGRITSARGIVALPDGRLLIHDLEALLTPSEEAALSRLLARVQR